MVHRCCTSAVAAITAVCRSAHREVLDFSAIQLEGELLDIIHSKEARENFLEFIYDHHSEFEKWQLFYQERSRIRIIEWLRQNHFQFVFEEDLDLAKNIVEKLKLSLFQIKVNKDIAAVRKVLSLKAKTYYSNEALNPRPKRGRPPKQAIKQEIEPQMSGDIYLTGTPAVRPFLFTPEYTASSAFTFSSKFETEEDLLANRRQQTEERAIHLEDFQSKLASLKTLSNHWLKEEEALQAKQEEEALAKAPKKAAPPKKPLNAKEQPPSPKAVIAKTAPRAMQTAPSKPQQPAVKSPAKATKAPAKILTKTPLSRVANKSNKGRPKGSTKKKRIILSAKKR